MASHSRCQTSLTTATTVRIGAFASGLIAWKWGVFVTFKASGPKLHRPRLGDYEAPKDAGVEVECAGTAENVEKLVLCHHGDDGYRTRGD